MKKTLVAFINTFYILGKRGLGTEIIFAFPKKEHSSLLAEIWHPARALSHYFFLAVFF